MNATTTRVTLVLVLIGVGSLNALAAANAPPSEDQSALLDALPDWVRNLKIAGDLRYRHEHTDDDSSVSERDRHRLRARLNVTGKVNDEVSVTFGFASGTNESATNTNQDMTDSFSSKDLWLDLAYFDYQPAGVEGLHVFGGKFKNPFRRVGNSDLMFDTDVRPEGIGGTYETILNEQLSFFSAFGGHYVEERSTAADTSLWAAQAGVTYKLPQLEGGSLTAGVGYFDYGNIQDEEALGTSATNFRGNSDANGVYESDYNILQFFGEAAFTVAGLPCRVFGDLLINDAAESDEDTGYLVGAGIGKCKKPGSWQLVYNYRDLEADAAVGALVDSTFGGGGTAVEGHKLSGAYQLAKNIKVGLNYMMAERTRSETTDHDVLQFEVNFKF